MELTEHTSLAVGASALGSFVLAAVVVLTTPTHGRFTMDRGGAVQKTHSRPAPRVGGAGIYLALVLASVLVAGEDVSRILRTLLLAGVPALLVGLLEDVTKRVGVPVRLAATAASGAVACWLAGISLSRTEVPVLDFLLGAAPIAAAFTALAVAGVCNAINIIDGFHGLASGTTAIALCAFALIAGQAGDYTLVGVCLIVAAAFSGFWLVNFPWGKLFLGDGGAYFAGFVLAWIAVLLPSRNASVSPWACLLVCGYPVIETVYSMARRWRSRASATEPDCAHLHSLISSRVVRPRMPHATPALQHAAVSAFMWICAAIPALAGIAWYGRTSVLVIAGAACLLLYHCLYRRVARA